jgi:hypothetical protein
MNSNVQKKIQAIALRMQGYTYQQIMKEIPIAKGTLAGWLKHVNLTHEQNALLLSNIEAKQGIARAKAAASNRKRREERDAVMREAAYQNYVKLSADRDFIIGLTLYWAEGTKKDVTWSFINSDPAMVQFMYKWAIRYLGVTPERIKVRLFIHMPYKDENLELFWAQLLGIEESSMQKTIYKPTAHIVKKNHSYKGCVRIYVTGIKHLKTTIYWKDALVNSLQI